ncbi:hypothetical protein E4U03_07560 [Rothia nasimurium]|uniref:Conjugal transfer protein TrbL n=1 Tax=Rothia nasimurium TaxID=85336 RepID=A0A4Y9F2L3_9MICC|nr:hypothetical protein [Rothia nasimurium]MBF0808465.1 hypothetical protein [Rothia nasimurium]TFU21957.1 hypothetical protein E4U03_07560 [Rothia nasimurium]
MSFFDLILGSSDDWDELIGEIFVSANDSLTGAFESSNITESWWAGVVGSSSSLGLLATWLPIVVIFNSIMASIQIAISAIRGSGVGVLRGILGAIFGIPLTYISVILIQLISAVIDEVTAYILFAGSTENANAFMKIFGVQMVNGEFVGVNESYAAWQHVGAVGDFSILVKLIPLLLAGIIWVLSMILSIVMSMRSLGIVILASFAGWAISALSSDFTKGWFGKWASLLLGLFLAKPFAAAIIVLSSTVFNHSDSSQQFIAGLAGILISIAMPFMLIKLISFGPVDSVGSQDQVWSGAGASGARFVRGGMHRLSRLRRK